MSDEELAQVLVEAPDSLVYRTDNRLGRVPQGVPATQWLRVTAKARAAQNRTSHSARDAHGRFVKLRRGPFSNEELRRLLVEEPESLEYRLVQGERVPVGVSLVQWRGVQKRAGKARKGWRRLLGG